MCGIVGIVSKNHNGFFGNSDDIFEELLYSDGLRGLDSTGVFAVYPKNHVDVLKQAVSPGIFLKTKSWGQFKGTINARARIVIGHNRKATVGEVISENAHPFVDKDIVLVHNGFIGNHKDIDTSIAVDSQAIITELAKHEKPEEGLKELSGAYALAWYNHKTKKFYLARNKERPLFVAHTPDMMVVASEGEMLEWILKRNGFRVPASAVPDEYMWEINPHPFRIVSVPIPKKDSWKPLPTSSEYHTGSRDISESDLHGNLINDPAFSFPLRGDEPLPELVRVRREAELTHMQHAAWFKKDQETIVKEMTVLYKPGVAVVLFRPTGMVINKTEEPKYAHVTGVIWQPGKPPRPAKINIPEKDADIAMDPDQPLVATVSAILTRSDKSYYMLDKLHAQRETFKDVEGNRIGYEEWQMVCESCACDQCAKAPVSHQIDFTSVTRHPNGTYSVVCADCIEVKTVPDSGGENGG